MERFFLGDQFVFCFLLRFQQQRDILCQLTQVVLSVREYHVSRERLEEIAQVGGVGGIAQQRGHAQHLLDSTQS